MSKLKPDWEGFGRAIMANHFEGCDLDMMERQEIALKFGVIVPIPGGFDPEEHGLDDEYGSEPGDPWFALNFESKEPT